MPFCFQSYRKGAELTVNMSGNVNTEGSAIVITSGSSATKTVGSPSSDGGCVTFDPSLLCPFVFNRTGKALN